MKYAGRESTQVLCDAETILKANDFLNEVVLVVRTGKEAGQGSVSIISGQK